MQHYSKICSLNDSDDEYAHTITASQSEAQLKPHISKLHHTPSAPFDSLNGVDDEAIIAAQKPGNNPASTHGAFPGFDVSEQGGEAGALLYMIRTSTRGVTPMYHAPHPRCRSVCAGAGRDIPAPAHTCPHMPTPSPFLPPQTCTAPCRPPGFVWGILGPPCSTPSRHPPCPA